jgi:hypothetical protein
MVWLGVSLAVIEFVIQGEMAKGKMGINLCECT